jgi:hypothetical protein
LALLVVVLELPGDDRAQHFPQVLKGELVVQTLVAEVAETGKPAGIVTPE